MPNQNVPHIHHYIPQFYLGFFTNTGDKKGRLWAHDFQEQVSTLKKPKKIAYELDFYMLNPQTSNDPVRIETFFMHQETYTAPIIKKIIAGKPITQYQREWLAGFIFMLLTRGPKMRMADALDVSSGSNMIALSQEQHMDNLQERYLDNLGTLEGGLPTFDWSIIIARPGNGEFVCADHPVSLCPNDNGEIEMYVPLSPQMVLKINIDRNYTAITKVTVGANEIATINNKLLYWTSRYVFSKERDFCWLRSDQSIGNKRDLYR